MTSSAPVSGRPLRPVFWALAQLGSRARVTPRAHRRLAAGNESRSARVEVVTRHGSVRVVVVQPAGEAPDLPVLMHMHGGGFVNRYPEQDSYLAAFLAAAIPAVVLLPDYSTGPAAHYPIAEEQMADVARWARGEAQEWDGNRLLVSGISAGAKLAVNVCQQLVAAGEPAPLAASLVVPVLDLTQDVKPSPARRPTISPFVMRFVQWAYFPDAQRRGDALASPLFDLELPARMPRTLVQTAGRDTLAAEGRELVRILRDGGLAVEHHEFVHADHGFYATADSAEMARRIAEFLTRAPADSHSGAVGL